MLARLARAAATSTNHAVLVSTTTTTSLSPASLSAVSLSAALRNAPQQQQLLRTYVSSAHPKTISEFPIPAAMGSILEEAVQRQQKREHKWEMNAETRKQKLLQEGKTVEDTPYRNQDETISLALNLNLDPRRPGQALRGSVALPHGTGKKVGVIVFTTDPELAKAATETGGALYAGGEELIEKITSGDVTIDSLDRSLATQEMMPALSKSLARVLGPRGLMPNAKVGTLFSDPDDLLTSLRQQSQSVQYRTEKSGIVHVPIGKASFGLQKLLDNAKSVCAELQTAKPEVYGKGKSGGGSKKKMGKNVKYWLKAYVSATQGRGVRVDLRTVDPSSPFFMQDPDAV